MRHGSCLFFAPLRLLTWTKTRAARSTNLCNNTTKTTTTTTTTDNNNNHHAISNRPYSSKGPPECKSIQDKGPGDDKSDSESSNSESTDSSTEVEIEELRQKLQEKKKRGKSLHTNIAVLFPTSHTHLLCAHTAKKDKEKKKKAKRQK